MLERIDIIPDLVSEDQIFENIDQCVAWVIDNIPDHEQSNMQDKLELNLTEV